MVEPDGFPPLVGRAASRPTLFAPIDDNPQRASTPAHKILRTVLPHKHPVYSVRLGTYRTTSGREGPRRVSETHGRHHLSSAHFIYIRLSLAPPGPDRQYQITPIVPMIHLMAGEWWKDHESNISPSGVQSTRPLGVLVLGLYTVRRRARGRCGGINSVIRICPAASVGSPAQKRTRHEIPLATGCLPPELGMAGLV